MKYKCVTADPPWLEHGGGQITRGAQKHYPLMPKEDIAHVMGDWLGLYYWSGAPRLDCKIDVDGCHLWLWVTTNYLLDGAWIMSSLGFRYVRCMQWVKLSDDVYEANDWDFRVIDQAEESLQIGLGQYLRGAHETVLFGVRGNAMVPETENRLADVVFAERGKHSRKPDKAIKVFESVSPGPRLELFARTARPGWDVVGDEV